MFVLARKWGFLALLPLLTALGFVSTPAYVCAGDGIARKICCCPEQDGSPVASLSETAISSGCCCDVQQLPAPVSPVEPAQSKSPVAKAFAVAPAISNSHGDMTPPQRLSHREAKTFPAPPTPSILLRKQSFLR